MGVCVCGWVYWLGGVATANSATCTTGHTPTISENNTRGVRSYSTLAALVGGWAVEYQTSLSTTLKRAKCSLKSLIWRARDGTGASGRTDVRTQEMGLLPLCVLCSLHVHRHSLDLLPLCRLWLSLSVSQFVCFFFLILSLSFPLLDLVDEIEMRGWWNW